MQIMNISNSKKKKICIITGTRAEYGLLSKLINEIVIDTELELQLVVTGMHLSPEFGLTYKEIEKEFKIDRKIEILLSSDTPVGVSKSMALAQISFSEAFEQLHPDIIVLLGDRFEIFSAAASAMILGIPIAHIHGGECTFGAFDESIRHSISKMSHIHFTATDEYCNRVIQLGEQPNTVFNVGGLGVDVIKNINLLSRENFEKSIGFKLKKKNVLVTFHPTTLEKKSAQDQFQELLDAFHQEVDFGIIFTKANSDPEGRIINKMIDNFVAQNQETSVGFTSLGQLRYLSALQYVDAVVGNSSSGLLEAPTFKIATINIGERQNGRVCAKSVINISPNMLEITEALQKVYSNEFQKLLTSVKNPYGEGGASKKIIETLKRFDFQKNLKKTFFDIPFS